MGKNRELASVNLREFTLDDAPTVARLVGDEAVSRWTSNIPFPYGIDDATAWIRSSRADGDKHPYAVEWNGELVGCVSYWPYGTQGVEVGYWVGRAFWGKGVCTRALRCLLERRQFPETEDVYAKIMVENTASQRVLEKCGFSFLREEQILRQGEAVDARCFLRKAQVGAD